MSSLDDELEFALSKACTPDERKAIGSKFGGEWSDDEEDFTPFTENLTGILQECFKNALFNTISDCFFIKSRAYNDNINDELLPAVAVELKVFLFSVSFTFSLSSVHDS